MLVPFPDLGPYPGSQLHHRVVVAQPTQCSKREKQDGGVILLNAHHNTEHFPSERIQSKLKH